MMRVFFWFMWLVLLIVYGMGFLLIAQNQMDSMTGVLIAGYTVVVLWVTRNRIARN